MANFFVFDVWFSNGTKRTYEGVMYYLNGQKAPGYYKFHKLKEIVYRLMEKGIVVDACFDFES